MVGDESAGESVAGAESIPEQLRFWLENAPVAMAVHDRDMRFLMVNERWRFDFSAYADGEVVGRSLYDVDPTMQAYENYHRNCAAGERLASPRLPLALRDGRLIHVSSTMIPWRTDAGEIGGVLGMYRVLDEEGGDRFELVRTQQRLDTAIRLAGILTWEMDYAAKSIWSCGSDVMFADPAGPNTTPSFGELENDVWAAVLPEDRAVCEQEAALALAEGRPFRAEHRLNRRDKEVWVASAMETVHDAAGAPATVLGVMTDITKRKQADQALVRALAAAEAANQAKSEFLANMSHEIRTPMNGVIGLTGLLLKTALTPEQRMYADAVRLSADALMHILNDILEISKLEAGKVELESVDFSLPTLVEDAVELMATRAQEKGLELAAYIDEGARGCFKGDPTRLRQVLLNLLSNAVKFTEQGHVAVDVRGGASADGRMAVRIEVRDTGIGLSDSAKRKLFQKFQQADGSITRRYGGTGLGLSISRQLVNLMGGEIGVADGESGGATFWVELELAPGAGQARVCRCKLAGARILVVDPGALNRDTFRRQLQDCGAEVAAVDGAEACLAALDEAQGGGAPFDLVLMDEMAGAAGEALVRGIRDGAGDVQPAIVMVASMAEPITARRAEEIGLDGYLTKPVRHQALGERLASILGRGEGDQAAEAEASAPRIAATPHGPVRVLLAEDNEINILLVRTILDQVGFSVRCVTNGREAVEAARNEAFDLILMDVQMPVMDGLEATRRIRALGGPVAQTPIVAMTANAMRRDREACLAAGMDDFISKPIDAEMFLALLDRLSSADPARSVA